jgi:hypothetical protein
MRREGMRRREAEACRDEFFGLGWFYRPGPSYAS